MELTQKKGRDSGQILCADLASAGPVAHTASWGGRTAAPHVIPWVRAAHPASAAKACPPGTAEACMPSQSAPRQSSRHAARVMVPDTTNTHGFQVFLAAFRQQGLQ